MRLLLTFAIAVSSACAPMLAVHNGSTTTLRFRLDDQPDASIAPGARLSLSVGRGPHVMRCEAPAPAPKACARPIPFVMDRGATWSIGSEVTP